MRGLQAQAVPEAGHPLENSDAPRLAARGMAHREAAVLGNAHHSGNYPDQLKVVPSPWGRGSG